MKKLTTKILSVVLTVVLLLASAPLSGFVGLDLSGLFAFESEALTSGDFTYTVSGGNATITGYSGSATDLTIPSTLGGYKVTTIKYGMFNGNNDLISVTLPSTLTLLGDSSVSTGVFQNCTKLQKVTFSEGKNDAVIGRWAFAGCPSLTEVVIPGNYVTIGMYSFENCISLKSLKYEKSSYSYSNQTIQNSCFKGCTNLKEVSLPTTLNSIGNHAFENCTSLETLVIPEGVTRIEYGAFNSNENLKFVSLPSTLTLLGDPSITTGVFQNCAKLEKAILQEGENDLTIGRLAFANCPTIKMVHLPLNTVSINYGAFKNSNINLVLCSLSNASYAKTYADANGIKFKICDSHEDEIKYTVTYNANGGSITPSSVEVIAKKSTTLPTPTKSYTVSFNANGGSNAPASLKAPLTCKGWSTSASATSATYSCGAEFAPTNNTTLYAVWNTNASFTVPSAEPTRDGYEFLGWATSNSSTTASIHAGDRVNVSGNVTYYAVWKEIPSLTVSQTELTLDLDKVDTGFATVTVNRPSNEALTLEAASSSTSVVMVELGDYDNTNDTCPATFIVKGEGTCTVTFKLYSADKSVLYDTETVTITVKQDATKQINMNYNGVTVIDDFDGVYFESLNPDIATVDDNGKITATGRGNAIILVTDIDGNISYYSITVNFSFFQWIIYIVFFGWLWY